MKRITLALVTLALFFISMPVFASGSHDMDKMDMEMGAANFKHMAVVDGIRGEFEIMNLKSMKMKDPNGATHHVMVKLFNDSSNADIKMAVGKIKVIAPDGSEQVGSLKNYNGIFAVNFTFQEKGRYGIICLLKVDGQKRLVKFWYPHHG